MVSDVANDRRYGSWARTIASAWMPTRASRAAPRFDDAPSTLLPDHHAAGVGAVSAKTLALSMRLPVSWYVGLEAAAGTAAQGLYKTTQAVHTVTLN